MRGQLSEEPGSGRPDALDSVDGRRSRFRPITCRSAFRDDGPVIVCIGEPGSYKEELITKYASHANERGFSLLAVDLLGTQTALLARNGSTATSSKPP